MKAREILQTLFDEFREIGTEITSDHDSKTAPLKGGIGIITLAELPDPYSTALNVCAKTHWGDREKMLSLVKKYPGHEDLVANLYIEGLNLCHPISTAVTAILTRAAELTPKRPALYS